MRKRQVVLAVFILMLFLAGCPGNGGASHSGGAVYTGGAAPAAGPSYSAQDILELSNEDEIEAIIDLLTAEEGVAASGSASAGSVAVTFDASAIGLPEGGRVTLTMTVDGRVQVLRATADADGRVKFDIPAVPTGSEVKIRMDVENAAGVLFASGTEEKTVTGAESSFQLALKPVINRSCSFSGTWTSDADVISNGDETLYVTLKDFSLTAGSGHSAFCIRNSHPGTVTTVYVDIQGTVFLSGANHGGFKLCTDSSDGGTIDVIFLSSSSGTLTFNCQESACSMQVEHLEGHSLTVMDGCTVSGMKSGDSGSMTSYSDWGAFLSATLVNWESSFNISR